MPFLSQAQQRWGNSASGVKALGGKAKVAEWNASTPSHLPEKKSMHAPNSKNRPALHKAMGIPEGRMVSMGDLMDVPKKKTAKPAPKAGMKGGSDGC